MSLFADYDDIAVDDFDNLLDATTVEQLSDALAVTADEYRLGDDPFWKQVANILDRARDEIEALSFTDPLHVH